MTYYKLTTVQVFDDPGSLGRWLSVVPYNAEIKVERRKLRRYR